MKLALCIFLVITLLLVVGCARPIVPPKHVVNTDFVIPFSERVVSDRCPDLLSEFLKKRHGKDTALTIERCFAPNLITCTVTKDYKTTYHWNVMLEAEGEQNTKIIIRRFIRARWKCIPLTTGEKEKQFINFLLAELTNENR